MDVSFGLEFGDPDLPEDNSPVGRSSASYENQIGFNGEIGQILVRDSMSPGPHFRLMLVPIMARLLDFVLDGGEDNVECLNGIRMRRMRRVEVQFFFRCCKMSVIMEPVSSRN